MFCQLVKLLRIKTVTSASRSLLRLSRPLQYQSLVLKPTLMSVRGHSMDSPTAKCQSLITQCIDNAFGENKIVHHSSLIPSNTIEEFFESYASIDQAGKRQVLLFLCQSYGPGRSNLESTCKLFLKAIEDERDDATLLQVEERMRLQLQPMYLHLFKLVGRLDGGVKFLIDMRHDALHLAHGVTCPATAHKLRTLSNHLKDTLSYWFSIGLLQLTRVCWKTPADILEKVAKNEAVHQVRSWLDLKHRLGEDRRCYMFIHSCMPREPLVYLHVALMDHIANNITDIVDYRAKINSTTSNYVADTAIFYSITSTQKGLQGIDFGVHIIRGVVQELIEEMPQLKNFSSLSPIPQFKSWLVEKLSASEDSKLLLEHEKRMLADLLKVGEGQLEESLLEMIKEKHWAKDDKISTALKDIFLRLCSVYLHYVKRRGYVFDPVANFHLRNGATLWRLNWLADPSANGLNQSLGIMANYRYYLDEMEARSRDYVLHKKSFNISKCAIPM